MSNSSGLQLSDTFISFPYINPNTSDNTTDRLVVDIQQEKKLNVTLSLKHAYRDYPEYGEYLQQQKHCPLSDEIQTYFDTLIRTPIKHKYKIGQFGYLKNGETLEKSFIMIIGISDLDKELYFLHNDSYLYEYKHYDITHSTPKLLSDPNFPNNYMKENEFIIIDDGMLLRAVNKVTRLLNWKIYREDYLTKRLKQEQKVDNQSINGVLFSIAETKESTAAESTAAESTDYATDNCIHSNSDIESVRASKYICNPSYSNNSIVYHPSLITILEQHGYSKDKDFSQTLKGEIFIGINHNKFEDQYLIDEPVAIKKMYNQGFIISNNNMDLIRESLILRNLKIRNSFVRDSIVNYIDAFQTKQDFYIVMELNWNVTLKEFVIQSQKLIHLGKLNTDEYKDTIKYLLWRLITTIHWLHTDTEMNSSDLDICPENIMLSNADFIAKDDYNGNNDAQLGINLGIEMNLIDVGVRDIIKIGAKDQLKQFECMYNTIYLSENEQFLLPNENILFDNPQTYDIWGYGMVVYFCFFGAFPYNKIPHEVTKPVDGFYAICNGRLKQYLAMENELQCITPKILSLLNGILNTNPSKRFDVNNILKHPWFSSFYKTYPVFCSN